MLLFSVFRAIVCFLIQAPIGLQPGRWKSSGLLRRPISWSPEIYGAYAAKNEVTLDRFVCGRNGIARHVVDASWTYIGLLATDFVAACSACCAH